MLDRFTRVALHPAVGVCPQLGYTGPVVRLCPYAIGWLAALCAVAGLAAEGPPNAPLSVRIVADAPPAKPAQPAFLLKTDADLDALMAQAAQLATAGQQGPAIEIYQGVIEKAEDRVMAVSVQGGADETVQLFVPAADAARRALLEGPKATRTAYAARFEPEAAALVKAAVADGDAAALRRIASRFPATVAAQQARRWSAAWLADEGNFAAAAAAWEEFVALYPTLGGAGEDLALALTQQILAQARGGQLARAQETLDRLEKEFPATKRIIGGTEQGVVEFARRTLAVARAQKADTPLSDAFAPTPRWTARTTEELSPFVCADGNRVFTRTLTTMSCLEMASGKRLWETSAPMQNRAEVELLRTQMPGSSSDREIVSQQRFATAATPEMVCCVENAPPAAGSVEMRGMVVFGGPAAAMPKANKFAGSSQLVARSARTGELRWRVGRGEGSDDFLRMARWVSSPVIVRDRVFVIALQIQSYHLVCLDAADGRVVWHSPISQRAERNMSWQGLADLTSASAPCVANGRVLCLTNGGVFAAFDQLTGEPRWFCQYVAPVVPGAMVSPLTRPMPVNPILVREQFAVILPADTDQIMTLDIGTGRIQWQQPRKERRFLAGVAPANKGGELILLTGATAAALSLDAGKTAWDKSLDVTAGRPVVRGGSLYVPSRSRGVVQLVASNGREVRCSAAAAEFRHLAATDTALLVLGGRSLAVLRSLDDALHEATGHLESAPTDVDAWRHLGELNLQAARFPDALKNLTKAFELEPRPNKNRTAIGELLFRCCLELAAQDPARSKAWLDHAATFATTAAMRSDRWLRVADDCESRKHWPAAADALQQILDHETEAWLDRPKGDNEAGVQWAGGCVSNRAMAAQRLDLLAEAHGAGVASRAEAPARRQLAEAVRHRNEQALREILAQHPVGETQERAWLTLATWHFEAQHWNAAAEVLLQFLLAEPRAAHRGDAALGVALAGIRSGRCGLARKGIGLMEPLPPKTRVGFAGVGGSAAEMRQSLSRELPSVAQPNAAGQGNPGVPESGREISMLRDVDNLGGGRLFLADRHFVRIGPDGARVMWTSAQIVEKRGASSSISAAVLTDSVILFAGNEVVALDADTGKLLWTDHGVKLGSASSTTPAEWSGHLVWNGPAPAVAQMITSGRPMVPGLRTLFLQGEQMLRLDSTGWIASISPRSGEVGWAFSLPKPSINWGTASGRTWGRYVALATVTTDRAAETIPAAIQGRRQVVVNQPADNAGDIRVAVVDTRRGRLLAVWNVPRDWPEFSIGPDGRLRLAESSEPRKDDQR